MRAGCPSRPRTLATAARLETPPTFQPRLKVPRRAWAPRMASVPARSRDLSRPKHNHCKPTRSSSWKRTATQRFLDAPPTLHQRATYEPRLAARARSPSVQASRPSWTNRRKSTRTERARHTRTAHHTGRTTRMRAAAPTQRTAPTVDQSRTEKRGADQHGISRRSRVAKVQARARHRRVEASGRHGNAVAQCCRVLGRKTAFPPGAHYCSHRPFPASRRPLPAIRLFRWIRSNPDAPEKPSCVTRVEDLLRPLGPYPARPAVAVAPCEDVVTFEAPSA